MLLLSISIIISSCVSVSKPKPEIDVSNKGISKDMPTIAKEIIAQPVVESAPPVTQPIIEPEAEIGAKEKIAPQIPYFNLNDLLGRNISLSDFSGKPIILFFWATWCPFCVQELPNLQKQYLALKGAGIEVLAINVGEPKERVEKFLSKKDKLEFPILLDRDSQVASDYDLVGIPTFILIDAKGKIKSRSHNFPDDYEKILK